MSKINLLDYVAAVLRFQSGSVSSHELQQKMQLTDTDDISFKTLETYSTRLGLDMAIMKKPPKDFKELIGRLPQVCSKVSGCCVSYGLLSGMRASVNDPGTVELLVVDLEEGLQPTAYSEKQFRDVWNGSICQIKLEDLESQGEEMFNLRWLLMRLLNHRSVWFVVGIQTIAITLLSFMLSFFSILVLDKVIGHSAYSTLNVLFVVAVVVTSLQAILTYIRTLLVTHCGTILDIELVQYTLKKVLALPVRFFESVAVGRVAKVLGEGTSANRFLTGQLIFTVFEVLALFVVVPVIFVMSWKLSLVTLALCLFMFLNVLCFMPFYRKVLESFFHLETKRQGLYVETLGAVSTIKACNAQDRKLSQVVDLSSDIAQLHRKTAMYNGASNEICAWLQRIMNFVIYFLGAKMVLSGEITTGVLIGFNILASRVSGPLVQSARLVSDYQRVKVGINSLGALTSQPPEVLNRGGVTSSIKGEIWIENLSFSYNSKVDVISNISVSISAGEKIGIVGKSGCGKSTLAQLLNGFYKPNSGMIKIDGVDISSYDVDYFRSHVGVVEQVPKLFEGSVIDNIRLGYPYASLEEVIKVTKGAGAHEFIEEMEEGYQTHLDEGGINLSGGQRQRLCLSRAMLGNPKIMIFDEATSALDPESEKVIMNQVDAMGSDVTLINISHRMSQMVGLDRVIVIDKGSVVGFSHHLELLQTCDIYKGLWNEQQGSGKF